MPGAVHPHSYLFYKVDSTYYAKNYYGLVDYSGSNALTVYNSAKTNLGVDGGTIKVLPGDYYFSGVIYVPGNIHLIGNGWRYSTRFYIQHTGVGLYAGDPSGNQMGIEIRNINLIGQAGTSHGLYINNTVNKCSFEYLYIQFFDGDGVKIENSHTITLQNVHSYLNGGNGFTLKGSTAISLLDPYAQNNTHGIYIEGGMGGGNIRGGVSEDNTQTALYITGARTQFDVYSLYMEENSDVVCRIQGSAGNIVRNVKLDGCHFKAQWNKLCLYTDYFEEITIQNSVLWRQGATRHYDIGTNGGYVYDIQNTALNGSYPTENLEDYPVVSGNKPYNRRLLKASLWKTGNYSSVSTGEWKLHYLETTPTVVILTPRTNVNVWCADRNSTHIQIGVSTGTVDIDYYVAVQP